MQTDRLASRAFAFEALSRWIAERELAPSWTGQLARPPHELDDVARDRVRHLDGVDLLPRLVEPDGPEERCDVTEQIGLHARMRQGQHLDLVLLVAVVDEHLEEEAVELGLGEREDALLLERVLGADHEERIGEWVALAVVGDEPLLHRLEQGGLRLRRRAVDLVREQDVREEHARLELGHAELEDRLADDLAGRGIRGELDALEVDAQNPRHRVRDQRLRRARRPLHQHVPVTDRGHQHQVDGVVVADHDLAHLGACGVAQITEPRVVLDHPHAITVGRLPRDGHILPGRSIPDQWPGPIPLADGPRRCPVRPR